jgi:hypothetical protein
MKVVAADVRRSRRQGIFFVFGHPPPAAAAAAGMQHMDGATSSVVDLVLGNRRSAN